MCIPIGVSHGPDGNIWIANNLDSPIMKMNTSGVVLNSYSTGITPGSGPFHIHPSPDGAMWFTEINSDPGLGRITTASAEVQTPTSNSHPLAIGGNGKLFFTENSAGKIGKFASVNPPYNLSEVPIPTAGSGPGDIVIGAFGLMWFTETNTDSIDFIGYGRAFGVCGSPPCQFPVTAGSRPEGIALGADGTMWFTEHDTGKIASLVPGTDAFTEYNVGSGTRPGSLIHGPAGDTNLYITEEATPGATRAAIGRINPFTHVITHYTVGITSGATVANLTVGPDNNIWFSEPNVDQIGNLRLH